MRVGLRSVCTVRTLQKFSTFFRPTPFILRTIILLVSPTSLSDRVDAILLAAPMIVRLLEEKKKMLHLQLDTVGTVRIDKVSPFIQSDKQLGTKKQNSQVVITVLFESTAQYYSLSSLQQ